MKALLAALVVLSTAVVPNAAASVGTIFRAESPPMIDGDLADECWSRASVLTPFVKANARVSPDEPTRVRLCSDAKALYIAFEASEPMLDPVLNMLHRVKAEKTGRDAAVFGEDCVEVFLQPPGGDYFHFAANSGEGTYEGKGKSSSWDGSWECATQRQKTHYTVEIAIPFATLGAEASGEWKANFTRNRPQGDELSTWCGLQGAFHQPEQFGTLVLRPTGPSARVRSFSAGNGSARVEATIRGGNSGTVLTLLAVAGEATAEQAARGNGEKSLRVELPSAGSRSPHGHVFLRLTQGESLIAESAPVNVSPGAGTVEFSLRCGSADCHVTLNGQAVSMEGDATSLALRPGTNVLALDAQATGRSPALLPEIRFSGRTVNCTWAIRDGEPPADWQTTIPTGPKWTRATGTMPRENRLAQAFLGPKKAGFWGGDAAASCRAVTVLYVGTPAPQIFPKMNTFFVPQHSSQLLRPYLHADQSIPSEGYRMIVEAPAFLRYKAFDALSCGIDTPVHVLDTVEAGGTTLQRYAVAFPHYPGQGMELSMRWGDRMGTTLAYEPTLTAGGTHDWKHLRTVVTAPQGAHSAHPLIIKWQNRGYIGTFWVDNVVFRAEGSDENLLQMGTFDEPTWKRSFPAEGPDGSKCVKIVSTPEKADRQQACWVDEKDTVPVEPGARYVLEFDVKCENLGSPTSRPHFGMLFQAEHRLPAKDLPLFTYFQSLDGVVTELPVAAMVRPLPELRDKRPEHARISPCYYGPRFRNPAVETAFAENCRKSGITWTYGKVTNGVVPHLLPRGHRVFLSIGWHAWGPTAGTREFLAEHEDCQAVDFKGKRLKHTVCPTYMLSADGRRFRDDLERWLLEIVNTEPYAGANWDLEQPVVDPPTFCTCPRCLKAFRRVAKLDEGVPLSPKTLLAEHRGAWTDFRCRQNADMAGHLKAILSKADRPIEFSMYSGYQGKRTKEHYGVDWKRLAPHLDFAIAGYGGGREQIYATLDALGDVPFMGGEMWYLSDRDDARPTPRMGTWTNRILRQYVESGCNGCLIWYLPPMDGGAFYATSLAAELIAQHETVFRQGTRCDKDVTVTGIDARNWAAFRTGDGTVTLLLMNFSDRAVDVDYAVGSRRGRRLVDPYGSEVVTLETP